MTPAWCLGIGIAAVASLAAALSLLSEILLPFVAGMAVAYFLDPLADRLEKWRCSRTLATSLITAAFFVISVAIVVLLFPLLQAQVTKFLIRVPEYASRLREFAMPFLERLETDLTAAQMEKLGEAASTYGAQAIGWIAELLMGLWSGGVALLQLFSLIVITPLVTFYLLRDWDRIVARIDALLPREAAPTIRARFREIDEMLAGFVRGQASVCLILGILYAVGLTAVGLDFGLLVGLGTGLISFVPYFGMLVGLAVGLGMAFAQFHDLLSIGLVAAVFAAGQIVEGQFLTPKLVGERVRLHPAWVIFALLAGGALFGFTGILLAIPAAAVIGVLVRFAIERYTQRPAVSRRFGLRALTAGPQLALAFDHRPSLSGDDFLVAPNNAEAVGWIDQWPDWPGPALVVFGPGGCGRTHLAHVFRTRSGARAITPADLGAAEARTALGDARAIVLDDADAMTGPALGAGIASSLHRRRNRKAEPCCLRPARRRLAGRSRSLICRRG